MNVYGLAGRLLTTLTGLGSMVAFVASLRTPQGGFSRVQTALIVAFVLLALVDMGLTCRDFGHTHPRNYKGARRIRNYMYSWIANAGRVEIYSRDLSWVADDEMKSMLRDKARRGDLTLVLPNKIPLSDELETTGAVVYDYPNVGRAMKSRFTIVNVDRADQAVAIGRTSGKNHYVEEFRAQSDAPVFALVEDLAALVKGYCTGTFDREQ